MQGFLWPGFLGISMQLFGKLTTHAALFEPFNKRISFDLGLKWF